MGEPEKSSQPSRPMKKYTSTSEYLGRLGEASDVSQSVQDTPRKAGLCVT